MARRNRLELTKAKLRSAITNGHAILADVDHRSAWMRRLRDLTALHVSDLGGEALISEGEKVLVRRASMITVQLEMMEARFADNDGQASAAQLMLYQTCANTLRRLHETLGLQRRAKDVTPNLRDYLAAKGRRVVEVDAEEEDAA